MIHNVLMVYFVKRKFKNMKCDNCLEEEKDLIKFENEYYCKECYNEHIIKCLYCKKEITKEDNKDINNEEYCCLECFDKKFVKCFCGYYFEKKYKQKTKYKGKSYIYCDLCSKSDIKEYEELENKLDFICHLMDY
jgi:hypothetical protein